MAIDSKFSHLKVQVYIFENADWVDKGAGYFFEEIQNGTPFMTVRNELDENDILMKSALQNSIRFYKKQDLVLTWIGEEDKENALVFSSIEDCDLACDFIIRIQRRLSPNIFLISVYADKAGDIKEIIVGPMKYPDEPNNENLKDVLNLVEDHAASQFTRTAMSNFIEKGTFVEKLIDVFESSERNRKLKNLHLIYKIMKSLICYNETAILEELVTDANVLTVTGILEYDTKLVAGKRDYRNNLLKDKKFLPNENEKFRRYVNRNFILQIIKSVASTNRDEVISLGAVRSLINDNQVDLINFFEDSSNKFLHELFKVYSGEGVLDDAENLTEEKKLLYKVNGIEMLHQSVSIARNLMPRQRSKFFTTLFHEGLMKMLNYALNPNHNSSVHSLGIEILTSIVEDDLSAVIVVQSIETCEEDVPGSKTSSGSKLSDDMTLVLLVADLFINSSDPTIKSRAFRLLESLINPQILKAIATSPSGVVSVSEYFAAFYEKVAPKLFDSVIKLGSNNGIERKFEMIDFWLFHHLCELFTFCSSMHDTQLCQPFIFNNSILIGISQLICDQFRTRVRLDALQCIKTLVTLNDDVYTKYIVSNRILNTFYGLFRAIKDENNYANSLCLSFTELVVKGCVDPKRSQSYRLLALDFYNNIKDVLSGINFVSCGKDLISFVKSDHSSTHSPHTSSVADLLDNSDASTAIFEEDDNDDDDDDTSLAVKSTKEKKIYYDPNIKGPALKSGTPNNFLIDVSKDTTKEDNISEREGAPDNKAKDDSPVFTTSTSHDTTNVEERENVLSGKLPEHSSVALEDPISKKSKSPVEQAPQCIEDREGIKGTGFLETTRDVSKEMMTSSKLNQVTEKTNALDGIKAKTIAQFHSETRSEANPIASREGKKSGGNENHNESSSDRPFDLRKPVTVGLSRKRRLETGPNDEENRRKRVLRSEFTTRFVFKREDNDGK